MLILDAGLSLTNVRLLYCRIADGKVIKRVNLGNVGRGDVEVCSKKVSPPSIGEAIIGFAETEVFGRTPERIVIAFRFLDSGTLQGVYRLGLVGSWHSEGGLYQAGLTGRADLLHLVKLGEEEVRGQAYRLAERWLTYRE